MDSNQTIKIKEECEKWVRFLYEIYKKRKGRALNREEPTEKEIAQT